MTVRVEAGDCLGDIHARLHRLGGIDTPLGAAAVLAEALP